MRNKFFTILGTTVLLITTAACGNPATSASSPGASSNITSPQVVADDGDPVAPHIATLSGSPLAEYMSLLWNLGLSREEQARQMEARTILIQETAAACMHEQGFEYYLDLTMGARFLDSDPALWQPEDRVGSTVGLWAGNCSNPRSLGYQFISGRCRKPKCAVLG